MGQNLCNEDYDMRQDTTLTSRSVLGTNSVDRFFFQGTDFGSTNNCSWNDETSDNLDTGDDSGEEATNLDKSEDKGEQLSEEQYYDKEM